MPRYLPHGRKGRFLALGITAGLLLLVWAELMQPVLDWQADRAGRLRSQITLAARMAAIVKTLPLLEKEAAAIPATDTAQPALLEGATEALAGAALQEKLDDLAGDAGLRIASAEALPAEPAGDGLRTIRLRVSVSAPWAAIITMLHDAAASASPLVVVDDVQLRGTVRATGLAAEGPLDATFIVAGLRRADPAP